MLACRALGLFVTPELALYDQLLGWRAAQQRPAAAPVVLVGATEEDLGRYGWPSPPRNSSLRFQMSLAMSPEMWREKSCMSWPRCMRSRQDR